MKVIVPFGDVILSTLDTCIGSEMCEELWNPRRSAKMWICLLALLQCCRLLQIFYGYFLKLIWLFSLSEYFLHCFVFIIHQTLFDHIWAVIWLVHCVPQKTCDYIFYNNFNNICPITIIFGKVSGKSDGFISHLTYLLQLPYLGKSQNTKNDQFRCKQHIVLWINNVLRHVWLLKAFAETARHRSNAGRSPSPHGWQISLQSYPLVTRQWTP